MARPADGREHRRRAGAVRPGVPGLRRTLPAAPADVSYFLGAGLLPEARRASERDLVRAYHQDLCRRGVTGYPFADCWEDYRRFSFSGLLMAVVASMIVGQTDRGDDMFVAMASRHAQQVLDLDALEFLDA